jgi:hypothetical protein
MQESSTYQAILKEAWAEGYAIGWAKGALAEAKKILRLQGDDAFGPPDLRTAAAIERLEDLAQLEGFLKRVLTAESWQELLGELSLRPRRRRRRPSSQGKAGLRRSTSGNAHQNSRSTRP